MKRVVGRGLGGGSVILGIGSFTEPLLEKRMIGVRGQVIKDDSDEDKSLSIHWKYTGSQAWWSEPHHGVYGTRTLKDVSTED